MWLWPGRQEIEPQYELCLGCCVYVLGLDVYGWDIVQALSRRARALGPRVDFPNNSSSFQLT